MEQTRVPHPHLRLRIQSASSLKVLPSEGLSYIKKVEGVIEKRDGNMFAFLKGGNIKCFVSPKLVQQHNIQNGARVHAIAALDYEKKKDQWNWTCIDIAP